MLLALSGLDGSQFGRKRAVVHSQDKKGQLHRGVFRGENTCCFDDFKYVCIGKRGLTPNPIRDML